TGGSGGNSVSSGAGKEPLANSQSMAFSATRNESATTPTPIAIIRGCNLTGIDFGRCNGILAGFVFGSRINSPDLIQPLILQGGGRGRQTGGPITLKTWKNHDKMAPAEHRSHHQYCESEIPARMISARRGSKIRAAIHRPYDHLGADADARIKV